MRTVRAQADYLLVCSLGCSGPGRPFAKPPKACMLRHIKKRSASCLIASRMGPSPLQHAAKQARLSPHAGACIENTRAQRHPLELPQRSLSHEAAGTAARRYRVGGASEELAACKHGAGRMEGEEVWTLGSVSAWTAMGRERHSYCSVQCPWCNCRLLLAAALPSFSVARCKMLLAGACLCVVAARQRLGHSLSSPPKISQNPPSNCREYEVPPIPAPHLGRRTHEPGQHPLLPPTSCPPLAPPPPFAPSPALTPSHSLPSAAHRTQRRPAKVGLEMEKKSGRAGFAKQSDKGGFDKKSGGFEKKSDKGQGMAPKPELPPESDSSEDADDAVPAHLRRTSGGLLGLLQWYLQ